MTENERYCVRAGYWHNYTGIGRCEDENLTTNEVCDLINEQNETIQQLKQDKQQLYRIESRLRVRIKELEKENQSQSDAIDGLQEMMAHYNLEDFE